jgi:hypothetical protein
MIATHSKDWIRNHPNANRELSVSKREINNKWGVEAGSNASSPGVCHPVHFIDFARDGVQLWEGWGVE